MALMKYKDVLVLAKEKVKEAIAPLRAKEMHMKGQLRLAQLESEIAEHEQKIQEVQSSYPLDFDRLGDALDNLDLATRRKNQLAKVLDEMFGE